MAEDGEEIGVPFRLPVNDRGCFSLLGIDVALPFQGPQDVLDGTDSYMIKSAEVI